MTSISLVDRSPYAMTTRARVYLGAAGGRHLLIGIALLCVPWLFHSSVYLPIFDFLPLTLWGVIMTVEGIACGAAAAWRNMRCTVGESAEVIFEPPCSLE